MVSTSASNAFCQVRVVTPESLPARYALASWRLMEGCLIAWFLAKAAWEFDAKEAVSLGGALAKLASATHGRWLLTAVAAGLLAFGAFCVAQARYRDV